MLYSLSVEIFADEKIRELFAFRESLKARTFKRE